MSRTKAIETTEDREARLEDEVVRADAAFAKARHALVTALEQTVTAYAMRAAARQNLQQHHFGVLSSALASVERPLLPVSL